MATISKTGYKEKTVVRRGTWYTKFIEEATCNYFFVISIVILIGSCWGGITAMHILKTNSPIWQLCINIYITMASNIAAIWQASTKWVVVIFGLSILINLALLLANVL